LSEEGYHTNRYSAQRIRNGAVWRELARAKPRPEKYFRALALRKEIKRKQPFGTLPERRITVQERRTTLHDLKGDILMQALPDPVNYNLSFSKLTWRLVIA
jgi:hypothetical protein